MGRGRTGAEAGFTLIELLVVIALLGGAIVFIVGALFSGVVVSNVHNTRAKSETVAESWAEWLVNPDSSSGTPYVACATAGTSSYVPSSSAVFRPSGYTLAIQNVQYWDKTYADAHPTDVVAQWADACSSDPGLQKITLAVTPPGNNGTLTLTVLKRNP